MIQKHLRFRNLTAMLAVILGAFSLSSCEKEEDIIPSPSYTIATNFVGTYVGISSCDTGVATAIINAGTDQTHVLVPAFFGDGDCRFNTYVKGYVSGNTMTIPLTSYTDLCFQDYTVKVDATRVNDSLFYSATLTTPLGTTTCSFMGKKVQ